MPVFSAKKGVAACRCQIDQDATVKQFFKLVAIITTGILGPVGAQYKAIAEVPNDGPTLQETLLWLKEKLANNVRVSKCLDAGSTRRSVEPTADNCWTYSITRVEPEDFATCRVSMNVKSTSYHTFANSHGQQITIRNSERRVSLPLYERYEKGVLTHTTDDWVHQNWQGTFITLALENDQKQIQWNDANGESGMGSQMSFNLDTTDQDDLDIAKRVAKAFGHAIDLCQSQKPRGNEPF